MMEYKRLTGQEWSENIDLTQELGYSYIYKRLYELETKIEQGKLIELPCKVGDTVWCIYEMYNGKNECFEEKVLCIEIRKIRVHVITSKSYIGKGLLLKVFLTREEAEKCLKELQE